jgi:GTP-binding protein Era
MNRTAASALEGADIVVQVVEATRWNNEDDLALERIKSSGRPALLAVNKVDRVHPRQLLLPYLASVAHKHEFVEVVPVSALKADGIDDLRRTIAKHLPKAPAMFPDGELTDRGREFRIAEMIRE